MFSIVIPVYNVAPYLRECLDCLLAQGEKNWEAICVDDGSEDSGGAILDEYAVKDRRIRVIHQNNAGVGAARNAALEQARGQWILFLDGDDLLAPWALAHLREASCRVSDADVIAFGVRRFNDGTVCDDLRVEPPFECRKIVDSTKAVDAGHAACFFTGKAYRREAVGDIRFKSYAMGEDQLFMLEVMLRSRKTVEIASVLYGYRQRMGSAVHVDYSAKKVCDTVGYNIDELEAMARAQKNVSAGFVRVVSNCLTEQVAMHYFALRRADRIHVWPVWREALLRARNLEIISRFQKLRLTLFSCLPVHIMALGLFYFPSWLKARGLHR